MAEEIQDHQWAFSKFYFQVTIADKQATFQEVSGLGSGEQTIDFREGDKEFSTIKMPAIKRLGYVTLRKGVIRDDTLWNWFNPINPFAIDRKEVVISLLDEEGNPTIVWVLKKAWPVKITGANMKSDDNQITVDTIELAHEGITTNF